MVKDDTQQIQEQFASMPTPAEMAEMSATFTAKLLADQSRFLEEVGELLVRQKE